MQILKIIIRFLLILLIFTAISYIYLILQVNEDKNIIHSKEVTLDEKISQMIILGYSSHKAKNNLIKYISEKEISGIIFYKKNIKSPNKIKNDINLFKSKNQSLPLFLIIDQEGGLVSRLSKHNGFKDFPSAQQIGNKYSPLKAYKIYQNMAKLIRATGFNFNLAPCVDVNNKNSNICKDLRCYSYNPEKVAAYSDMFIKAHMENNVITAIKHYPGLGSATNDSHSSLPDISSTWQEKDLIPFQKILEKYPLNPIIVGHSYNSKLDKENITSLSSKTINKLNPQGIIIIDALDMNALKNEKLEDAIYKAINAGVNLFIFPNHEPNSKDLKINMTPIAFRNIVQEGLKNKQIDIEKINISYDKIKQLKEKIKEN